MNELDCLLISPPSMYKEDKNIWTEINSNFPPLGLASIAAYARSKGHSVKIIDSNISAPSVETFREFFKNYFVRNYSSIKVIGLSAMTCTIKKAYKIMEICREYYPDAKYVFGGVHPTFLSKEVLENGADIVVIGEGELTFEEIVAGKKLFSINGITYKQNKKVITNKPRERITKLDMLPMPAYDLLPILKYKPAKGSYKRLPAMSMMTSRGCPGRCTFCQKTLGNAIFFESAEKIFEEIQYLVKNYGIKQILFYDDTFTVYKDNVIRLCNLILRNKLDISWTCFARVDYVDFEMLKKMNQAGCHQIMYGVETIDKQVLENIHKGTNPAQVINAVRWTKAAGIECRLAFMVGNPGDDKKSILRNIQFVNKVNPDLLIVNITTPFPGTEMFEWAKQKNLILTYNWDDYTLAKPVMRLENLTPEQIKGLYQLMYKKFYFRPVYIIKKLTSIRTIDDIKVLTEGFNALLSFFSKSKKKSMA